jgi:YD repeat-containing protein
MTNHWPSGCTYADTDYANPHAPTAYSNGTATTTYGYDNNGNLTQSASAGGSPTPCPITAIRAAFAT